MHSFQLHNSYTGAAYYQHDLLFSDMLIHGFFTRKGGVSKGVFSGLNSALNSGDQISDVNKNRQIVTQSMTHKKYQLITLNQIHGNRVITIDSFDSGRTLDNRQPISGLQADGLVTNRKDVLLGILTADCAPILMADNKVGVIGACQIYEFFHHPYTRLELRHMLHCHPSADQELCILQKILLCVSNTVDKGCEELHAQFYRQPHMPF